MTITVTIEEVKTYQQHCIEWAEKRAGFALSLTTIDLGNPCKHFTVGGEYDPHGSRSAKEQRISKWDRENPFPNLIPRI